MDPLRRRPRARGSRGPRRRCPDNLAVTLAGHTANTDVLRYYDTHRIDAFVNLSTTEGVPVSIMEAIARDIPIVATRVGGTPEIVGEEHGTGRLGELDATAEDVATTLAAVVDAPAGTFAPRARWEAEFDVRSTGARAARARHRCGFVTDPTIGGPSAPVPQRRWALDVLRIVSVIGVVAIHVFGNMVGNDAVHGSIRWWGAVIVDLGFVWVVPVFVMISGALILEPRQYAKGPADFYRRRLLRLGPAFVFWPLFYVFVVSSVMAGRLADWRASARRRRRPPQLHAPVLPLVDRRLYVVAPVLAAFLRDGGRRRAACSPGSCWR